MLSVLCRFSGTTPCFRAVVSPAFYEAFRRICQYREMNKSATQVEIGSIFGVDRRYYAKKEKYLSMEDETRSPIKTKRKIPDIEKALANWAKDYQRQEIALTDAMMKEEARRFAEICGEVLTPNRL